MSFKQVIFWGYDTAVTDGIQRTIQLRIMRESRDPLRGQRRGLWDTTKSYLVDDFVYTIDAITHVATRWYCIQANTGNAPTNPGSIYWTKADHFEWAYTDDPTAVLIIPGLSRRIIGGPSPISAHPTKEQGKLTPESFDITLNDFFQLTSADGAVDGTGAPVTINWLSTDFRSFINELFDNPDALTTWSWNQIIDDTAVYTDYADPSKFDMYWMGDSTNSKNSTPEEIVLGEEGENALQVQQVRVTVDSLASRMQSYTVRDFLDTTKSDDTMFQRRAFFGNWVADEGSGFGTVKDGVFTRFGLAATTINDNLHFAPYEDIIVRMILGLGCSTDPTKWSSNVQPWKDTTNQTTKVIESSRVGSFFDHTWLATTGVCFERKFCFDYRCDWAVQEQTFSEGYSWDTPLSTVLEKIARQWICKIEYEYDQTAKQPVFLLRDVFESAVLVADALTANVSTGDATISVSNGTALFAASDIIEISDKLNIEYAVATAGGPTSVTIERPNPVAFASGAVVNAIQSIPSARSGRGDWRLVKSVREQQTISAGHVETKATTDDDTLASPHLRGEAISIEMPERTKLFNPIGTKKQLSYAPSHTYNGSMPADKQKSCWQSWAGGRSARCIIAKDATITLVDNTQPHVNVYKVESTSTTFFYLNRWKAEELDSFWDDESADVVFFSNGAFAVVISDDTYSPTLDGQNAIYVAVNQFQSCNPPVVGGIGASVSNETITVGFEGPHADGTGTNGRTVGTFSVSAGSTVAILTSSDAIPDQNIFKNEYVGMQFIFPKYGVFTLITKGSFSGGLTSFTFDRSFPIDDPTAVGWAGGPDYNPDMGVGAYMWYDNGADQRYDPRAYSTGTGGFAGQFKNYTTIPPTTTGFYWGAYTVNRLAYGLPDGTTDPASPAAPDDSHGCESYMAAQVYAELYIGNFTQVTRTYNGVAYSDGLISSVRNGMMWYEYREGSLRFYQVLGRDIDTFALGRGQTVLHCIEKKPRRDISRNKVWVKGRNSSSGGASTVGGASGVTGGGVSGPASTGTIDLGGALLQKPNTPSRNKAIAGVDGVIPLEVQLRSQYNTDPLFVAWDSDGTTKLTAIDYHGNPYLRQGTLTLANGNNDDVDISTYASYLISGPSAAFAIRGLAKPTLSGTATYRLPVTIVNTSAQTLTLKNNDSGSAAGNRLRIPGGDVTLVQHEFFTVEYDLTNSEWVVDVNKAPVTLPTDMVVTDPTTGQNIVQPITAGVVGMQLKAKSGDTADITRCYDNAGTLKGLVNYVGGIDWKYTISISPIADVPGLVIDKASTDSTHSIDLKDNGSTVAYATVSGDFNIQNLTGVSATLVNNNTLVSGTCSATATSNTIVLSFANTGTSGRGQFSINTNGSVQFGPLDKNSTLTKGFGISGNPSTPVHTISTNTTLDGAYHYVRINTGSANVTVTLPSVVSGGGPEFILMKVSPNNSAILKDSGGTTLKTWTANNQVFIPRDNGTSWDIR